MPQTYELAGGGPHEFDFKMLGGREARVPKGSLNVRAQTTVDPLGEATVKVNRWSSVSMHVEHVDFGKIDDPDESIRAGLEAIGQNEIIVGSLIGARAILHSNVTIGGQIGWPCGVATGARLVNAAAMEATIHARGVIVPATHQGLALGACEVPDFEVPGQFALINCMNDDMWVREESGSLEPVQRYKSFPPITVDRQRTFVGYGQDDIPVYESREWMLVNVPKRVPNGARFLVYSGVMQMAMRAGVDPNVINRMVVGSGTERDPQTGCQLPVIKKLSVIGLKTMAQVCEIGF